MFDGEDFRTHGKRKFEEHNERIRSLVPEDKLLVLSLGDGWDPLCRFLDLPRPTVDYPFGNTVFSVNKKFEKVFWVTCAAVAKKLVWYTAVAAFMATVAATGFLRYVVWRQRAKISSLLSKKMR